jgi:hypothetical protein
MDIRSEFIKICEEAELCDKENDYMDCRVLEPYFQKIIALEKIEGYGESLKSCFIAIINGQISAPYELLPYCMRHFRCAEVLKASISRLGIPADPRYMNFHSKLSHAVRDVVWEDSDFWQYMS